MVVVSFAEPERLKAYQKIHQWPFVLLADPERKAYGRFDLQWLPWYRVFSFSALKLYFHLLRKGRKLESYGREDIHQAGGDFLLDQDGNILFAHRSRDPADRPEIAALLERVEALSGQDGD